MHRRHFLRAATVGAITITTRTSQAEEPAPNAEDVKALTLTASQLIADKGIEQARAAFNQEGPFKHGEVYVNVIDHNGTWVVYPPKPEGVGKVILNLQDADGKFLVKDILQTASASDDGGWVEYRWKNPATNKIQQKVSFAKKVSGTDYTVYVGIYK